MCVGGGSICENVGGGVVCVGRSVCEGVCVADE